ncbi:MAG: ATP-binding protein [Candidatus Cloacimonadaceae bacterium]|nr:ATP-binding protein [Candidatus Cloacimonadota bacterium]MCB5260203.1 ATP-binding protein [Candidatus Cloacimonadota bacterium]MCK9243386.1 ATP-binding protein [Candidatus Cloacimonadota bacterium]MDY0128312.1 ATP-binding protein [Candidatus Cloacimonadaceae bacterium]
MATAEQIKALVKSHFGDSQDRFFSVVLQIAAHEALQGHASLANDLREIVNAEKRKKGPRVIPFPQDLRGLVLTDDPFESMAMLVISEPLTQRLGRIVHEYRQQDRLKSHGLKHRRKILLIGPSGTGKTMTARVIAHELNLQLHTVQVDRLVTKFMGETGAKLRQIFDLIQMENGVYLFDEFDAIGGERSLDNDVGEMRRVLNSFLQFIEQDVSDSLIFAATNTPELLDRALFRRFDDVLYYDKPNEEERLILIKNTLGLFINKNFAKKQVLKESEGLSQAELVAACRDSLKNAILAGTNKVTVSKLLISINERKEACQQTWR